MLSVMIVAMIAVHREHGLFAANGIEVTLLYATAALALTGYGSYSLDAWLGLADRWTPATTWIVLGAGALGGFANLAIRRRPALAAPEATRADRH